METEKNCSHTTSSMTLIIWRDTFLPKYQNLNRIQQAKRALIIYRKLYVKLCNCKYFVRTIQNQLFFLLQVLVTDPEQLEKIRDREADITKERIMKILNSGANVILTTGGIDDLCLKYFVEAGAMAVRRCKKVDLKRIAKCTGAQFITSLANLEGEESFEASFLGITVKSQ